MRRPATGPRWCWSPGMLSGAIATPRWPIPTAIPGASPTRWKKFPPEAPPVFPPRRRSTMDHQVVSREDWLAERKTHLEAEKALPRQRDTLLEARRALPWGKAEKDYVFAEPAGPVPLGGSLPVRSTPPGPPLPPA